MPTNGYGEEIPSAPVTLPKLAWLDKPMPDDTQEMAARIAERRIIRNGLDAWQTIGKAESFDNWCRIGAALAVGKAHALRVTGANRAWGSTYSREFNMWMKAHGFDAMTKSVRSVAIELHENAKAIEAWRATLPERQRKRLIHPLSNVRRWRAATTPNGRCPADLKRDATAAWRRFVSCMELLPPNEARPLWQTALTECWMLGACPFEQSDYQQQNDRSDNGVDDRRDKAANQHKANLRQQPTGNKSTDDADYDVANEAKTVALHDQACEPTCNSADNQQNDKIDQHGSLPTLPRPMRV